MAIPRTFTPTGGTKVTLYKNGEQKLVDPGAADYYKRVGGYTDVAPQINSAAPTPAPSLTQSSSDIVSKNFLDVINQAPAIPTLEEQYAQVQQMFQPLSEQRREDIRASVAAEFAPRFSEQQKVNELQANIERAQSAQRGQTGFGAGRLAQEGQVNVAQAGANAMNQLQALQAAETNARILAAESTSRQEQQNYLELADKFRQNQLDQFQQFFQNQLAASQEQRLQTGQAFERAQSQLNLLADLSPADLQSIDKTQLQAVETSLGLPAGYIDALQATKLAASQVDDVEKYNEIVNQGTKLALTLPQGQSFDLATPDGETITFTGMSPDELQVVSNKNGIFTVNKRTGAVTQQQAFAGSGGGGGGDTPIDTETNDMFLNSIFDQSFIDGDLPTTLINVQEAVNDLPLTREQKSSLLSQANQLVYDTFSQTGAAPEPTAGGAEQTTAPAFDLQKFLYNPKTGPSPSSFMPISNPLTTIRDLFKINERLQ